jgi:hypothetical protein
MLKRDYIISQLCGMVLIAIGVVGTLSIGFVAISSIKHLFFQSTPLDTKYATLLLMFSRSLINFAFVFLFIVSGIGVLRFKEWARKVALVTLVLFISMFCLILFVLVTTSNIYSSIYIIMVIGIICISISIIYFLTKKSIKEQFNGEKKRKLRKRS